MSTTDPLCTDCGACCMEMCAPLFAEDVLETSVLPPDVAADYTVGMAARERDGWPENMPCFWLGKSLTCRHYNHRPPGCREFNAGSEVCMEWRRTFGKDKS